MKVTKHQKIEIIRDLLLQVQDVNSPYSKQPIYGYSGLYFAHPGYKHSDYNKWRACDIQGNEQFCELVIKLYEELS